MPAQQHFELTAATAVVTGASSGIGRAIALELAAAGTHVIVHARSSRAAAEQVAVDCRALGVESHVLLADLAEPEAPAGLVERAWNWRGAVDIWVNNAGADVLTGDAAHWTFAEKLAHLWKVDVAGSMHLARDVGARMKQRGQGAIINIGWDQAATGMAGDSGELFAATKGAVMAFTKSLAASLAPEVRVNCVAPGWIKTEWGDGASEYWQQRATGESLLDRWGNPQDVAAVVRFLVSPAASFLTAQIVPVNGGFNHSQLGRPSP